MTDLVKLAGEYFVERKVTNVTAEMAISGFALWAADRLEKSSAETSGCQHEWIGGEAGEVVWCRKCDSRRPENTSQEEK